MAVCITPQFGGSTCPQLRLTVTQSATTTTTVTLTWLLEYVAHGYAASTSAAKSYNVVIAGSTVASGTYNINGITTTKTITSGTKVINRSASEQTVSFSCSMSFNLTWGTTYGGTKSASGSISIPASASYTITYNANGGSGAPSNQTKWTGTNITLSSAKPSRTGYVFNGWATTPTGSVTYVPSSVYSTNASITLYAVWTANTYTVTYNANGGTGGPTTQIKTHGVNLILSGARPIRANYSFKGWGVSPSSTTIAYPVGGIYQSDASIILYAIWSLSYSAPHITNFTVDRCTSGGSLSEEGTYARVIFYWACGNAVSSVKIEWGLSNSSVYNSISVPSSGTNGSVTRVIGSGTLNPESLYSIRAIVSDGAGSTIETRNLSQPKYIIDVYANGTGVAIGKPADKPGFDVGMDMYIDGKSLKSYMLDLMYPVNSIYISYSHSSPNVLFGGSWTRISDAFLWGVGPTGVIGTFGGAKTHTLTAEEMPRHTHLQREHAHWLPYSANASGVQSKGSFVVDGATSSTNGKGFTSNLATLNETSINESTGSGGAHNNMPPYMQVSIWRRLS